MMGFRAVYHATCNGTPLLGAVMQGESSVWSHREDAESYLASVIELNRQAGRPCEGEVREVRAQAEIVRHCPDVEHPIAQAVGCVCPHCKEIVK